MTEYRKARMAPIPSTRLFHNSPTRGCSLSGRGDGRMGGTPGARLGNGVVAVPTPRVAPAHAAEGQPRAPHGAGRLEGLKPIGRAGRDVTAGREAGTNLSPPAVEADTADEDPAGRTHARSATARSSPMAV